MFVDVEVVCAPAVAAVAHLDDVERAAGFGILFDVAHQDQVVEQTATRFVGYPIAETDEWVTVLNADTRYIMRIPQASIDTRLTCHNEDDQLAGDRPLLEALKGNPYDSHNIDCRKVVAELRKKKAGAPFPLQ